MSNEVKNINETINQNELATYKYAHINELNVLDLNPSEVESILKDSDTLNETKNLILKNHIVTQVFAPNQTFNFGNNTVLLNNEILGTIDPVTNSLVLDVDKIQKAIILHLRYNVFKQVFKGYKMVDLKTFKPVKCEIFVGVGKLSIPFPKANENERLPEYMNRNAKALSKAYSFAFNQAIDLQLIYDII